MLFTDPFISGQYHAQSRQTLACLPDLPWYHHWTGITLSTAILKMATDKLI